MNKRLLSLLLCVSMALTLVSPAGAAVVMDSPDGSAAVVAEVPRGEEAAAADTAPGASAVTRPAARPVTAEEPEPADQDAAPAPEAPAEGETAQLLATYSGSCGNNLTWSLDTGTGLLTITGSGAMKNYSSSSSANPSAPWYHYRNNICTVVIDSGVTTIGNYAFDGCAGLTSVTIPASVTSIRSDAFYGCTGLTSVSITDMTAWCEISFGNYTANPLNYAHSLYLNGELVTDLVIPDGVTSIGYYAFCDCTGLTSVTIPASVTSIDYYAFDGCTGLTSVSITDMTAWYGISFSSGTSNPLYYASSLYLNGKLVTDLVIPDGVTTIGDYAFNGCANLTSVTIPAGVTGIGNSSFSGCTGLASVTIPASVTSIDYYAFYGCTGLTSVTIPASVTSIGGSAFQGCTGLTSVTIPEGVTYIRGAVFAGCTGLTSITIPAGVTGIGNSSFSYCSGLTSITIPEGVTYIDGYAFRGCTGLTSITIPAGVTSIGYHAFDGCTGLTSITIPVSVTAIGDCAFDGCTGLTEVTIGTVYNKLRPGHALVQSGIFAGGEVFWFLYDDGVFYVGGTGAMPDYVSSSKTPWYSDRLSITSIVIGEGVTDVGKYAFDDAEDAVYVTLPSSIARIGEYAFGDSMKLAGVYYAGSDQGDIQINYASNSYNNSLESATWHYNCEVDVVVGDTGHGRISLPAKVARGDTFLVYHQATEPGYVLDGVRVDHGTAEGYLVTVGAQDDFDSVTVDAVFAQFRPDKEASATGIYGPLFWHFYDDGLFYLGGLGKMPSKRGNDFPWKSYGFSVLILGKEVTYISRYAFDGTSALAVYFEGDVQEKPTIDSYGNNRVLQGNWNYNCVLPVIMGTVQGGTISLPGWRVNRGGTFRVTYVPARAGDVLDHLTVDHGTAVGGTVQVDETGEFDHVTVGAVFSELRPGQTLKASGTCGTNAFWYLYEDGMLYIGGSGKMRNYEDGGAPWYDYYNEITSVVFSDDITSIGSYAFENCWKLTDFSIPPNITYIASYAFYNCEGLKQLVIPDTVTQMGWRVLAGCTGLTELTIPFIGENEEDVSATLGCMFRNSISNSGVKQKYRQQSNDGTYTYHFRYAYIPSALRRVTVTGSTIPYGAFYNCSMLTSVSLPNVKKIGGDAFYECTGLERVDITDLDVWCRIDFENSYSTPLYYAKHLYLNGKAVEAVTFPQDVTEVKYCAFYNCAGLTRVTIPAGVTKIGSRAFDECDDLSVVEFLGDAPADGLGWSAFPTSAEGRFAIFYHQGTEGWDASPWNQYPCYCIEETVEDCSTLDEDNKNGQGVLFTLNEGEKTATVGTDATSGTNTSGYSGQGGGVLRIPATVRKNGEDYSVIAIGSRAFYGNRILRRITLGANLRSLSVTTAFYGCSALEAFEVEGNRYCAQDGVLYDYGKMTLYRYPEAKAETEFTVPDTVYDIITGAFRSVRALRTVTIPDSVEVMGADAFAKTGIQRVTLPFLGHDSTDSEDVGYAFPTATLKEVTVTQEALPADAFRDCTALERATAPAAGESIPEGVFYNCQALTYLKLGDSVVLDEGVMVIPEGATAIGTGAFYNCGSIVDLTVPTSVTAIGKNAFIGCSGLIRASLPTTYWGFSYILPGNVREITVTAGDPNAIDCSGLQKLERVELPAGATQISGYSGCTKLSSVRFADHPELDNADGVLVLPEGITSIGSSAFNGCTSLTDVTVPDTVTAIGASAFAGCTAMVRAVVPFAGTDRYHGTASNILPASLKEITVTAPLSVSGTFKSMGGLERVTLLAAETVIPYEAFSGCTKLVSLHFGGTPEGETPDDGTLVIPSNIGTVGTRAFENCDSLTKVVLHSTGALRDGAFQNCDKLEEAVVGPEVTGVASSAFYNCPALRRVEIGAAAATVAADTFRDCPALEKITVDKGNQNYCSDRWGVLYTADKKTLMQYPAGRPYPYYNVSDETTTINSYAFQRSTSLVNLYIPATVTTIQSNAVSQCPKVTLCVYLRSPAKEYAISNDLDRYYMDNLELLAVEGEIREDYDGILTGAPGELDKLGEVYVVGDYGPIKLQLDDYEFAYVDHPSGLQMVVVTTSDGKEYTLDSLARYDADGQTLLDFGPVPAEVDPQTDYMWAVIYGDDGQMRDIRPVLIHKGSALIAPTNDTVDGMEKAKLFFLKPAALEPVCLPAEGEVV